MVFGWFCAPQGTSPFARSRLSVLLSVWVRVAVLTKPWLEIFTRFHADFNKKPHYFATHSVRKPAMGCPDLTLVGCSTCNI